MKINLLYGDETLLSGHENVKLKEKESGNLDWLCENAECEVIIANDVIDYYSSVEIDEVLSNWISKLRHQGTLVISGLDLTEVSKAFLKGEIDLTNANSLLFGDKLQKKCTFTLNTVVKVLESWNLKIIKKRINCYYYMIEAKRL